MDYKWNMHICNLLLILTFHMVILRTGTSCQFEVKASETYTFASLPCKHNIPVDSIFLVQWFKSSDSECYQKGDSALVSWDGEFHAFNNDYDIGPNFSLVIPSVTTENMGIYRCAVFQKDSSDISEIDTRLTVYQQPEKPPVINYSIRGNDTLVSCSVGPVYPLRYPAFQFPHQANDTVQNVDGTYMTSVSAVLKFTGNDIMLYCTYSNRGEAQSSHLKVHYTRDDNDGNTAIPSSHITIDEHLYTNLTEFWLGQGPRGHHQLVAIQVMTLTLVLLMIFIIVLPCIVIHTSYKHRMLVAIRSVLLVGNPHEEPSKPDYAQERKQLFIMVVIWKEMLEESRLQQKMVCRLMCRERPLGDLLMGPKHLPDFIFRQNHNPDMDILGSNNLLRPSTEEHLKMEIGNLLQMHAAPHCQEEVDNEETSLTVNWEEDDEPEKRDSTHREVELDLMRKYFMNCEEEDDEQEEMAATHREEEVDNEDFPLTVNQEEDDEPEKTDSTHREADLKLEEDAEPKEIDLMEIFQQLDKIPFKPYEGKNVDDGTNAIMQVLERVKSSRFHTPSNEGGNDIQANRKETRRRKTEPGTAGCITTEPLVNSLKCEV